MTKSSKFSKCLPGGEWLIVASAELHEIAVFEGQKWSGSTNFTTQPHSSPMQNCVVTSSVYIQKWRLSNAQSQWLSSAGNCWFFEKPWVYVTCVSTQSTGTHTVWTAVILGDRMGCDWMTNG